MPLKGVVTIGGTLGYKLRHIGPQAAIWANPPNIPTYAVLNQPAMISRPLPMSDVLGSPDLVSGQWTARLEDAGDGNLTFPNGVASDGVPHRDRFDSTGHNQWLEVYNDGYLESVICVMQVNKQQPTILVSGLDGYGLTKKAYERDLTVVQSPRDIIERGTKVWMPLVADNFPAGGLAQRWQLSQRYGASISIGRSGGVTLGTPGVGTTSSSDTQAPSTGADVNTGGSISWSQTGEIRAPSRTYAVAYNDAGGPGSGGAGLGPGGAPGPANTHSLRASNFGFSIPSGATLTGIVVEILRYGEQVTDNHVFLVKPVSGSATEVGNDKAHTAAWPYPNAPSAAYAGYGGSSDLWGLTYSAATSDATHITVADVNSSQFGVDLSASIGAYHAARVDFISIQVFYTTAAASNPDAALQTKTLTPTTTGVWTVQTVAQYPTGQGSTNFIGLQVTESSGDVYLLKFYGPQQKAVLVRTTGGNTDNIKQINSISPGVTFGLNLESDGEWINAYVNGLLVGQCRRASATTTSITTKISLTNDSSGAATATLLSALIECQQPFLMAGSDKGDYVLPGDMTTYPTGGLHARYSNNLDYGVGSAAAKRIYLSTIHAPSRSQAWGSQVEYINQADTKLNGQSNPSAGAAASQWSCVWFGSIYLKLSAGTYTFSIVLPNVANNCAVRVWVGKTLLGTQAVDQWNFTNAGLSSFSFRVAGTVGTDGGSPYTVYLPGTLAAKGGTVARDGWYPIKIEYAVAGSNAVSPTFNLTNSPAAYTDPGGTSIASGAQTTVVPTTSLSPLGCVDQRYQGTSHFDLIQQTAQAYGYQFTLEPQRLESGLFPGVLAPRIREGFDSDAILSPDTDPRKESILNYSSQEDASDFAASLQGNGAGFQNGSSGQLQSKIYDPDTLATSLFDVQGWQDFSDASFASLLQALLTSQLALRLQPWQMVSADPVARERLARSTGMYPLPASLWGMRWRPGDGVRLQARDISLWDTSPRQLLTVQRSYAPSGSTGVSVGWANRARHVAQEQRKRFYTTTRMQRSYQRQFVALTSPYMREIPIKAGATANNHGCFVSLLPGDVIVGAILRVLFNSTGVSFNVVVNSVDATSTLNGPWTGVPVIIDLIGVAAVSQSQGGSTAGPYINQFAVALKNNGAGTCLFSYQLYINVMR